MARQRSCTAYGWKARQNGWGIWLFNASICQGSSDFFSFSDNYKIFALRDSKLSPLNEPSQRMLLGGLAASQQHAAPAVAGPRIPCRYLATLSSENSSIRANFFGVVANATPFLSLMQGSPACRWQTRRVCFMLHAGTEFHHCSDVRPALQLWPFGKTFGRSSQQTPPA